MNIIFVILMVSIIFVIAMMLQRVFQGPTVYDRMNGLGVIGADTILLLVLFGYIDNRPDMYVDIAISYASLGFVGSETIAKFLGGKNIRFVILPSEKLLQHCLFWAVPFSLLVLPSVCCVCRISILEFMLPVIVKL